MALLRRKRPAVRYEYERPLQCADRAGGTLVGLLRASGLRRECLSGVWVYREANPRHRYSRPESSDVRQPDRFADVGRQDGSQHAFRFEINLLDNWDTGGLHGYASGSYSEEQNARDGNRVGKTMAQKVSHTNGLPCHTFDPCYGYPHPQGHIDSFDFGFNLSADLGRSDVHLVSFSGETSIDDKQTIAGPLSDFMSYNLPPLWISSHTTCQLIRVLWKSQDADCTFTNSRERKEIKVSDRLKVLGDQKAQPPRSDARYGRDRAFLFAAGVLEATGSARLVDLEIPIGDEHLHPVRRRRPETAVARCRRVDAR